MKRLIQGVHKFRSEAFQKRRELYLRLGNSQNPQTLFITCSDSRIVPHLITQAEPGDLFIVRNAGNFIPPFSSGVTGEGATIEYAVRVLKVRDIVICGHSGCGAIQALLAPQTAEGLSLVPGWLRYASRTAEIMATQYAKSSEQERLNIAIQENVLVQLENLRTYPFIAEGLEDGSLGIHAWVYKISSGEVFQYHYGEEQFLLLPNSDEPFEPTSSSQLENRPIGISESQ
jgi:carbonic anhydrase